MTAPACGTCTHFLPGSTMLDPVRLQPVRTGGCDLDRAFRMATDTCARHEAPAPDYLCEECDWLGSQAEAPDECPNCGGPAPVVLPA